MKLSVIIPVYNASAYIDKCVQSLVQFAKVSELQCEIIVIDDGSEDWKEDEDETLRYETRSYENENKEEKSSINIKIIHQENRGVSAARNRGLEMAAGDYVWLVDADDYCVRRNENETRSYETQRYENETRSYEDEKYCPKLYALGFVWDENGVAKNYEASDGDIPYNLWRCWFDRNEIERQNLRFTVGRKYAEDQEFILKYLLGCRYASNNKTHIVKAIKEPTYYYTMRPGSAMTKKGAKQKQMRDIAAVLCGFVGKAIRSGKITDKWVWLEMKRMAKTLYVVATK